MFSRRYRTTVGIRLVVVWKNYPCPAIRFGRTSFREDDPQARDQREAWRIRTEMDDVSWQQVLPGKWEGKAGVVADGERGERLPKSNHFVSGSAGDWRERRKRCASLKSKELISVFTVVKEFHRWSDRKYEVRQLHHYHYQLAAADLLALIRFSENSQKSPLPPGLFPFPPTVFSDCFSRFVVMLFLLLLLFSVTPPPPLCFSVGWTPLWISHRHPGPQSCF